MSGSGLSQSTALARASPAPLTIVAYDEAAVRELLRTVSAQQLIAAIHAGRCFGEFTERQTAEILAILYAWSRRALGPMPLRDALLVDPQRGRLLYNALCTDFARERCTLTAATAARLQLAGSGALDPASLTARLALPNGAETDDDELARLRTLADRAVQTNFALAYFPPPAAEYPFPTDLETLLPPLPYVDEPGLRFEYPSGRRQVLATALASLGVILLGLPLLGGAPPPQPAGLPLALLTLALLIGIRASWSGYLGSLCIWLVANLPGFHFGSIPALWPSIPLLVAGVLLLALDRRIRIMWRWIRRRGHNRV